MKLPVGGAGLGAGAGGGGGGDVVVEDGSVVEVTARVVGTDVVLAPPPLCPRFAVAPAFVNVLDEARDVVVGVTRAWVPDGRACPVPADRHIAQRGTKV